MKEADIDVRGEYIDVGKCGVFHASRGVAIVEEFGDVLTTVAHLGEPLTRDRGEIRTPRIEPRIYPRLIPNGAIESKKRRHRQER